MDKHLYIIWLIIILFLILTYSLFRYFIKKYFESRKGRYDLEKNYISVVAFGVLLAGFLVYNPTFSQHLYNLFVQVINSIFGTSYKEIKNELDPFSLLIYSVLCISVVAVIIFSYRGRRTAQFIKEQEEQLENEYKENQITFPEPSPPESPHLYDRIKELFEIKYKKHDLKLKQSANNENVLYGYYEDDFDRVIRMIYCDDRKDIIVSEAEQIKVYTYFQNEIKPAISKGTEKGIRDYTYYILTSGTFESKANLSRFTAQTEDKFLNSIIDFKKYLRNHLLYNYNNSKIFSSIKKEEDKKTLAKTFIAPSFYIGNEKSETCEDLKDYIDKWLTDTSEQKHLILLGDYGMGKSSFLKYYSATLAKEILNGKPFKRFPVFISLTNTSPRHGGINQTIKAFVAEHLGVEYALFEKLVYKGKILFLLDALDEMGYIGTHEQRFKQVNEIWQLAVSNNKLILSGRPSYFPTEFELKSILNIPKKGHEITQVRPYSEKLILNPLDNTRIKKYIGKYYTDDEATIYFDWIKNNNSIHDLCRRPSMMHIIREIIPELYKQNQNKLINASDVFEQYINFWFDRQEEKGVPSVFEKYSPEKKSLILNFYKELASDFHLNRILKDKSETIIKKLHSIIDAEGIKGFDKKEFIEGFEAEILTGYFIEIEDDEYKFVHKSFFEYFLANKIIELIEKSELNHNLISDNWVSEVVDFIYDAIPEEYKSHNKIPALYLMSKTGKINIAWHFFRYTGELALSIRLIYLSTRSIIKSLFCLIALAILILLTLPYSLYLLSRKEGVMRLFHKSYQISFIKGQFNYKENIEKFLCYLTIGIEEFSNVENRLKISDITSDIFDIMAYIFMPSEKIKEKILEKLTYRLLDNFCLEEVEIRNKYISNVCFGKNKFRKVRFSNCTFNNIRFKNSELNEVEFEKCKINGVMNFYRCTFSKVKFDSVKLAGKKITIRQTGPYDLDGSTFNSLHRMISGNKLKIDKNVFCDEWLETKLKEKFGLD